MVKSNRFEYWMISLFVLLPIFAEISREYAINSIFILVIQLCILFVFLTRRLNSRISLFFSKISIMFLVLFIVFAITIVVSPFPIISINRLVLVFFNIFVILFFLENIDSIHDFLLLFAKIIFLSSFAISIYLVIVDSYGTIVFNGTNEQTGFLNIWGLELHQTYIGRRPAGIFDNPNAFAMFTMLGIGSSLQLLNSFISPKNNKIMFILIGIVVQLYSLYLSGARSSLLGILALFLVLLLLLDLSRYKLYFIIPLIILALIFASFKLLPQIRTGLNGRDIIWSKLLVSIMKTPVFGVGFGVSNEVILHEFNLSSHNVYLKILSETGLSGFLVFLYVVFRTIRQYLVKIFSPKTKLQFKRFYCLFLSLLVGVFVQQMFETSLFVFGYFMNCWIVLMSIPYLNYSKVEAI